MHNDKCSPKHNTPTACDSTVGEYESVGGQNVAELPLNFATSMLTRAASTSLTKLCAYRNDFNDSDHPII